MTRQVTLVRPTRRRHKNARIRTAIALTKTRSKSLQIGGPARGYHAMVSRFRHPSRPAVGQHAVARSEYLCIQSRTGNARFCRVPDRL